MNENVMPYKLNLSGSGIKIDKSVSTEVAQKIVALVMGVPIAQVSNGSSGDRIGDGPNEGSAGGSPTAKSFLASKRPNSDVERIAVLAFYLDRHKQTRAFKTSDLTKLNTEAAGSKFSNAAYAVNNAAKQGFLTAAGGGKKQITPRGESLVEALPNREAVKAARETAPLKKRRKKAMKRK